MVKLAGILTDVAALLGICGAITPRIMVADSEILDNFLTSFIILPKQWLGEVCLLFERNINAR